MLKSLIALFILQPAVFGHNFAKFNYSMTNSTLLSIDDKSNQFSYISQQIDCTLLDNLSQLLANENTKYRSFSLPRLVQTKNKEGNEVCYLIYENIFNIDYQVYWDSSKLVTIFTFVLDSLVKAKYCNPFDITVDSFGYDPVNQLFVFFDLVKVGKYDQVCSDEKKFREDMSNSFLKSFIDREITLTQTDLESLGSNGADTSKFSKEFISNYESIPKKISLVERVFKRDQRNGYKQMTFIQSINDYSRILEIDLHDEPTKIYFNNTEQKYILYSCKRENGKDDCEDNPPYEIFGKKTKKYVGPLLYQNFEITEVTYKKSPNANEVNYVYEIFQIFDPAFSCGLNAKSIIIFKEHAFDKNFEPEDFIFCQSGSRTLAVGTARDFERNSQLFYLAKFSVKVNYNSELIQIAPSFLKKSFTACHVPNVKVFYLKGKNKNLAITKLNYKNVFVIKGMYGFTSDKGGVIYINDECPTTDSNFFIEFASGFRNLIIEKQNTSYPPGLILKHDDDLKATLTPYCSYLTSIGEFRMRIKVDEKEKNNFIPNFNVAKMEDDNPSRQNIVYLSKAEVPNPQFEILIFNFPDRYTENVFISILKEEKTDYNVKVVFYDNKKVLREIQYQKGQELNFKKPVLKLTTNNDNSYFSRDTSTQRTYELEVSYASEKEVVYKKWMSGITGCNAILKIEEEQILRIYCDTCLYSCDRKKIEESEIIRKGLKRVIIQANPNIPSENKVLV